MSAAIISYAAGSIKVALNIVRLWNLLDARQPSSPPVNEDQHEGMTVPTTAELKKTQDPRTKRVGSIKNLVKYFPIRGGLLQRTVAEVKAVDDISFFIKEGETLGLVGESGCGKTSVGRTILRLIPPTSGSVLFDGIDVLKLRGRELKAMRRNMQIIFQDPYASLDPRVPIGESVIEGLKIHNIGSPRERMTLRHRNTAKGWLGGLPCPPVPSRVFRGPAPADWDRASPGTAAALYRS
jgi:ABC-type glutathione transport system ATPase component